ncbi:MAG: response regulator [Sideroxydans sp.]|nr:response regulator [Sideroxydans sp.]
MELNQKIPKTFCTTREAANLLSISVRTAQLWVESGLLEAWKTEGGHRRISRDSVERLLASPGTQARSNTLSTPAVAASANRPQAPLNILVVEDEPNLRRLYEINLRQWELPHQLRTADDGYEGLVRIGSDKPDLLITDLRMPGMDGFRMLNAICSMPELSGMKIVIVSGLNPSDIYNGGGIPDGISILPKPIPFDRLRQIAEELARSKQSRPLEEVA